MAEWMIVRRWTTAAAAGLVAAVAVPAPAAAHAGLGLVVNDDGRGSISVEVAWADGHPVTGPIAGTLLASGPGGAQVGPAPLRRLPGTPTLVHDGTLAAGAWQVTVDVALPGVGHCAAPVTVAAAGGAAQPGTTRCAPPARPPRRPQLRPAPRGRGG